MNVPAEIVNVPVVHMDENPELVAILADSVHAELGIPDFKSFEESRATAPQLPVRPLKAEYSGPIEAKRMIFEAVNREYALSHQKQLTQHAKDKKRFDILNLYPADMAGYGSYLIAHHPQVLEFFGKRRPFHLNPESRRLHTYLVGGSGSGKSECLKSMIHRYLTEEPETAVVYIDPHNDAAEQVAKFRVNEGSGRLVYVKPSLLDDAFPGLNPFDISGKDSMSDKEAEEYADEFICAFREILEGNLTDQMETLLKNTVPVIVKMPDTSVYDLIDFLRPKPKAPKPAPGSEPVEPPYLARRYLDFAHANFKNAVLLDFLDTQFDEDGGYVVTRNSLTTRLSGIFGTTVMQGLFRGPRTVRLEELIRNRKLIVFNLSELRQSALVGKFIVITLKIFAINQARVATSKRVPCHVFVDEAQRFISGSTSLREILEESRKFKLYLCLAQQVVGARMDSELLECVLSNCATKIVGVNDGPSADAMARTTGASTETIKGLRAGQFVVHQRAAQPATAVVRMPVDTLGWRACMGVDEWRALLADQVQTYYARLGDTPKKAAAAIPTQLGEAKVGGTAAENRKAPLLPDIDAFLSP